VLRQGHALCVAVCIACRVCCSIQTTSKVVDTSHCVTAGSCVLQWGHAVCVAVCVALHVEGACSVCFSLLCSVCCSECCMQCVECQVAHTSQCVAVGSCVLQRGHTMRQHVGSRSVVAVCDTLYSCVTGPILVTTGDASKVAVLLRCVAVCDTCHSYV